MMEKEFIILAFIQVDEHMVEERETMDTQLN